MWNSVHYLPIIAFNFTPDNTDFVKRLKLIFFVCKNTNFRYKNIKLLSHKSLLLSFIFSYFLSPTYVSFIYVKGSNIFTSFPALFSAYFCWCASRWKLPHTPCRLRHASLTQLRRTSNQYLRRRCSKFFVRDTLILSLFTKPDDAHFLCAVLYPCRTVFSRNQVVNT